ncbi:flavin reductase family protein [Pseudomonas sp. LRP2-20]|uniref:flavin reductase family protein n=1 Tax=Pseudomonas sp. LRP2-20 TaxID=2944234 RepID=UPI0021C26854|nr:flavin reductase family protein [Pseudomonas sp. LRP2-20]
MRAVYRRELRDHLGRSTTGVCIVTTQTPSGRDVGLTINSFVPMSLGPPLVAWSQASRSSGLAAFS